jgi:hypothetical protein
MSEFGITKTTVYNVLFGHIRPRREYHQSRYDLIRSRAIELGGIEVEVEEKEESNGDGN